MPDRSRKDPAENPPKRSYYYDDATGYEDYDPEAEDDETGDAAAPSEEPRDDSGQAPTALASSS